MKLGDFRQKTKDLGDDVLLSIAEIDEAAAMHVTAVEIVDHAKVTDSKADAQEAVDLTGGKQKTVILRF